jgi:hypothetical protein
VAQENCFGDRAAPADLCPSHPDVRAYAVALARAVARTGVDAVVAESLHFAFFGHGYHHERSFVELGALVEFVLGLCFCADCLARATALDVDAPAARARAAGFVASVFDGGPPRPDELSLESLAENVGTDVAAYVRVRVATVTSLVADVAAGVAEEGSRLIFLDLSGALLGYSDGCPTGGLAADAAWRIGVDPAAVGTVAPGYALLAYARDTGRVSADVSAYRAVLGPHRELRAVLRPGLPDTSSAEHLSAKVAACAAADAVDFYNYGMAPWPVLDRIPHALKNLW